ncbi:hypothetical protein LCGC14_1932750 [marine sediment metagenome]|uniref:Calcineurin-like phosphoesterase domain-containing protein n=1 Tax=marine sediment metagenome TaxID=412755 RepID=A0A0F9IK56_9ZZZZ
MSKSGQPQRWSDADLADVRARRAEGESWKSIADSYGVATNAPRCAVQREENRRKKESPTPVFEDWQEVEDVNWRELLDSATEKQDLWKRIDPRQEHLTISLDTDTPIALAFSADLHTGGGFTNHQAIKKTLELILDTPNMYMSANGDMFEGFIPGEKSAETVEQQAMSLREQFAGNRSLVKEYAERGKLLYVMWGDHDAKWFEKLVGVNIVKMMTDREVPYFNQAATVNLKVGDESYLLFVNHSLPGRSMYNKNHAQGRAFREQVPADVIVSGHTHKPAIQWEYRYERMRELGYNLGGKVTYVQCGTFKTGPDPYSTRFWSRGIIGVPTLVFWPGEHRTHAFDNPEDAAIYLRGLTV